MSSESIELALTRDSNLVGEDERIAIGAFHKALQREAAGKPENPWPDDDNDD